MSLIRNTVPVAGFGVLCLGMVFGINEYSQAHTSAVMEKIASARAEEIQQRERRHEAFLAEWEQRKEAARKAEAAERRAQMLAALPGDPKKGRMTFMTCLGCHGLKAEGSRGFKAPRLAGQAPWYLKRQLENFRAGVRGAHPSDLQGAQMAPMARMLAGTAVDDVIAYLMTLDPGRPADTGSGDPAAGQEAFALCATCHGPSAEGMETTKAPRLSHQHAWYLERQISNFRGGLRGAHASDIQGQQMAAIAQTLSDQQMIADLIAYIQSLGR